MFYSLPQANVLQEAGRDCVARLLLSVLYELKLLKNGMNTNDGGGAVKLFRANSSTFLN